MPVRFLMLSDTFFVVIVQQMGVLHAEVYACTDEQQKKKINHTSNRFTVPTGDTYHNAHTDDCFQKIKLFVLTDQPADGAFEGTGYHPHILTDHGFGFALSHEDGGFVLGVAKHTKFNHVPCRDFTQTGIAGLTEKTDRYRTFRQCLEHVLLGTFLLDKKQVVYGWYQYRFGSSILFFSFNGLLYFFGISKGNEMNQFFFIQEATYFLFLTVECTDSIPWLRIRLFRGGFGFNHFNGFGFRGDAIVKG